MNNELIISILVHVLILFTFLSLFFFFFVSKIEERTFQNEMGDMIDDNMKKILTPDIKNYLSQYTPVLQKVQSLYSEPDRYVQENNRWIKISAIFVVVFLLSIITTILIFQCSHISMGGIISENIVTFLCIGIVEYWFFTNIAIKWIPTSPSLMIDKMFSSITDNL